jgi:ABC-type hemin transport system ATPase subunit
MAHNVHVEAVNSCAIVAGGPTAETVSDGEAAEAEEVKIAVMGVTGSGKSTFIRTMTGDLDICVGHTLQSGILSQLYPQSVAYL